MGLGRFPEAHFWRSQEAQRAAGFRLERDGADAGHGNFLRLGVGAPIYVEQIVGAAAQQALKISVDLRAAKDSKGPASLAVTICRKWMLTSRDCRPLTLQASAAPGTWQTVSADLPALPPDAARGLLAAPLKLSLISPQSSQQSVAIDVDNVQLKAADGAELLDNGGFSAGMDHWFFATDIDPPWHIHNLAVALWFDQGWFGLLAGAALALVALARGGRAAWQGQRTALAAFAGLVAFLVSGSLNTLVDAPRFLGLLLVLAWLCASAPASRPPVGRGQGGETRAAP